MHARERLQRPRRINKYKALLILGCARHAGTFTCWLAILQGGKQLFAGHRRDAKISTNDYDWKCALDTVEGFDHGSVSG